MVQEPSKEATARACLHSIPVEGCTGLQETRKEGENQAGPPQAGYQILSKSYNTEQFWVSVSTSEEWDISPTSQDYYDDRLNKQISLK